MVYFVRNEAGWKSLTQGPDEIIGRYFRQRGILLEQLAKVQVGKKSRKLERSIHYTTGYVGSGFLTRVGSDNEIALLHHNGTRPHTILPKTGKTLRFHSHGKIVYARVVHHPGTKANRFLTDNLRKVI